MSEARTPRWRVDLDMRGWVVCMAVLGIVALGDLESRAAEDAEAGGLVPLGDLTLQVIPQSHLDLAWWWRYDPETVQIVAEHTLETAFANCVGNHGGGATARCRPR